MGGKKLYSKTDSGGIKFSSGRRPGEVRIPNYVYDLWLPLIGTDALTVYAVYCRLEREDTVKAITLDTIAKCCRIGKATLYKANAKLQDCGFIVVKSPQGNARAHHHTTEITVNDPPQEVKAGLIEKYKADSGYEPLSKWLVSNPTDVLSGTSRSSIQNVEDVLSGTSTMLQPSGMQPSSVEKQTRKPKWESEDLLIDVWAGIRQLDAIAMGADYHTDQDRRLAKKMLKWAKPITADEIKAAMQRSKHPAYPFSFLEKDVLAIRAEKPIAVHPSHVPFPAVETTPDDVPMTPEATASFHDLMNSLTDEVTYAKSA